MPWCRLSRRGRLVALPERRPDLRALLAEVLGLGREVVERDLELELVERLVPVAVGRVVADEAVDGVVERLGLVGDLAGDLVGEVVGRLGRRRLHVGERGVDLGLAGRALELRDGLAELLAVGARLVGLGGRPDGERDGGQRGGGEGAAGDPLRERAAPAGPGRRSGRGEWWSAWTWGDLLCWLVFGVGEDQAGWGTGSGAGPPSTLMCGSLRSSHFGSHQVRSPQSSITAGSRTQTMRPGDQDRRGQADAELLDGRVAVEDEAGEDRDHDRRRRGDDLAGPGEAVDDGLARRLAVVDLLAHAADEEHLVVHREPEQDREHHHRHVGDDRDRAVEADRGRSVAVLEHGGERRRRRRRPTAGSRRLPAAARSPSGTRSAAAAC